MAWPHHHQDSHDPEVEHLNNECHQLAQRLADVRVENRQLCVEIGRLREQLARELAVRFGREAR